MKPVTTPVERRHSTETRKALREVLTSLEAVRAHRLSSLQTLRTAMLPVRYARTQGEIWGLDVAINSIKRRLR